MHSAAQRSAVEQKVCRRQAAAEEVCRLLNRHLVCARVLGERTDEAFRRRGGTRSSFEIRCNGKKYRKFPNVATEQTTTIYVGDARPYTEYASAQASRIAESASLNVGAVHLRTTIYTEWSVVLAHVTCSCRGPPRQGFTPWAPSQRQEPPPRRWHRSRGTPSCRSDAPSPRSVSLVGGESHY